MALRSPDVSRAVAPALTCLLLFLSALGLAADKGSPREWTLYLKDLEKFQKSLTLAPIELSKTNLKSGDSVAPVGILVNRTSGELITPLSPIDPLTSGTPLVGAFEWFVRRKDGKPIRPKDGSNAPIRSERVGFSALKPGASHRHGGWLLSVDVSNLASGDYELVLNFNAGLRQGSGPKVIASQVAAFTVDNPNAAAGKENLQKQKDEKALRASVSKQMLAALRLGELAVSNTSVVKGGTLAATCELRNPTAKDVLVPPELLKYQVNSLLGQEWRIVRQSSQQAAGPLGIYEAEMPEKGVFGAGKSVQLSRSFSTADLEAGSYELNLIVTDALGSVIAVRKQKFRVIK